MSGSRTRSASAAVEDIVEAPSASAAVDDVVETPSAESDADDGDAAPRTVAAAAEPEATTELRRDRGKVVRPFREMWEASTPADLATNP
jgi:hypothetical protein